MRYPALIHINEWNLPPLKCWPNALPTDLQSVPKHSGQNQITLHCYIFDPSCPPFNVEVKNYDTKCLYTKNYDTKCLYTKNYHTKCLYTKNYDTKCLYTKPTTLFRVGGGRDLLYLSNSKN